MVWKDAGMRILSSGLSFNFTQPQDACFIDIEIHQCASYTLIIIYLNLVLVLYKKLRSYSNY